MLTGTHLFIYRRPEGASLGYGSIDSISAAKKVALVFT